MQNLLLWLELVCVETVNGSTHPIPKGCRWCGAERAGRLPSGSPQATSSWVGTRGNQHGHGSLAEGEERGSSRCLGRDRSVVTLTPVWRGGPRWPGAKRCKGGAIPASPPARQTTCQQSSLKLKQITDLGAGTVRPDPAAAVGAEGCQRTG